MASVPIMGGAPGMQPVSGIGTTTGTPGTSPVNTGISTVPQGVGNPILGGNIPTTQNNPYVAPQAIAPAGTSVPLAGPGVVGAPSTVQQGLAQTDPNYYSGPSKDTVAGGLNQTYGQGIGTGVADILANMGTVNDSAIQATIANTDLAANNQYANIQAQEAAGGVSPNSSTAALASGDFYSQVNSQLQQTIGQQEVSEENTQLNALMTAGNEHGPNESTFDTVMTDIGDII